MLLQAALDRGEIISIKKRSRLVGELATAVDNAISEDDDIVLEVKTYRGYGLVVTQNSLLLVMGGVLAGLKPHEQHVERLRFDEIASIEIVPQSAGCFNLLGIPPSDLIITPLDTAAHVEKWSTLAVDFRALGETVKIACHVHEQIGRRKERG